MFTKTPDVVTARIADARAVLAAAQRDSPDATFLDRILALEKAVLAVLAAIEGR